MQFKYPEILYALLLLIIPIIVHLFQLRRFEKIAFTNVKFLKKVELQTRKSAKLKKFLILLSRLGLFTAIIFAFAQPYFSSNKLNSKPKTILYLDNSLSMQAKDGVNSILQNAIQEIISNYKATKEITLITNTDYYKNISGKELKNQLLSIDYHSISQDINTTLLKASKLSSLEKGTTNHLILLSDFQNHITPKKLALDNITQYNFVQLTPTIKENIAIDSLYINKQNGIDVTINIILKSYHATSKNLAVSLFKEQILQAKTTTSITKNKTTKISFKIPITNSFNGRVSITDPIVSFDNDFYFSLNKPEKINVLAIGENVHFLSKIYTKEEFNYIEKKVNQLDYNTIANQHLILLNELEKIPISLQNELSKFIFNGGSLAIIPALKSDIPNYNQFFNTLQIGALDKSIKMASTITTINFSHPILNNVFEKKINNFQYPTIQSRYLSSLKNTTSILKLDNQQDFITQIKVKKGTIFWIATALNQDNSNFKNSPLIVPIFYNFGKQSFHITKPFYTIGTENKIEVKTKIKKDEVLQISNATNDSFIPLQIISQNSVSITTQDKPTKSGFYKIQKEQENIKNIAFNYNRLESSTQYANIKNEVSLYENATYSKSIKSALKQLKDMYKINSFWRWFVSLAILFFILEMLLIKFMK